MPEVTIDICDMALGEEPGPADIYGWTSTSYEYAGVVKLAYELKQKYPAAWHIIGGPHATAFREHCDAIFDAVFVGEGERALVKYLREAQLAFVDFAREPDRVREPEPAEDLDKMPWPERVRQADVILDMDELPEPFRKHPEGKQLVHGAGRSITVMASRGCPFNCSFCSSDVMWGRHVRWRSPVNVANEIRHAKEHLGVTDVAMIDDCLTANRRWFDDFCAEMMEVGVRWRFLSRVNGMTLDMYDLALAAGAIEVCFGVESFDPAVLKALNKHTTPEENHVAISLASTAGLQTRVFMMISTPGESEVTADLNIAALKKSAPDISFVTLSTYMPLPGTPIWNDPAKYGIRIIDRDLSHHNRYQWGPQGENEVWSPVEIDGLPRDKQLANIRRMRDYVGSISAANKGRPV
jgi:radical SAM superfamily enzyme YgiQ (UPF0313 family)